MKDANSKGTKDCYFPTIKSLFKSIFLPMNTPPMKPEQLSPTLSPMALSLDDTSNTSGFSHLLASPTKLKLDNGGPGLNSGANGHSLIYRTSLSKLSELSRTGRSRQRSNSDTLRSSSPIRFQLFNNAPKMLKPEYISQQPSTLPLLSTLMKQSATGMASTSNKEAKNRQGETAARAGIRETLRKYQDQQFQINRQNNETKQQQQSLDSKAEQRQKVPEAKTKSHQGVGRNTSESASGISGMTLYERQRDPDETIKIKASTPDLAEEEVRVISNSSLVSSAVSIDFNNLPKELDLDALPSDKNGFVQSDDFKRCSFISSTSTDYDADWYNHQQVSTHEETAKLDHRIKQLELEIEEMKLQNEKLIQSITASRTVEDIFVYDAINEIRSSKQEAQRGMQRKVMQLEKKVENYKKVMKTLGDSPVKKLAPKDKRSTYPMGEVTQVSTLRKRISRISSTELRKIEEQGSSSSSSSDDEKEAPLEEPAQVTTPVLSPQQDVSSLSFRRKAGLQLNIHVEPLGDSR